MFSASENVYFVQRFNAVFVAHQVSEERPDELDARQSLWVARPAIPLAACYVLVISQSVGLPASIAVLALLVV